jgi:predicted ribosome quality control (RQC) complex YloA/Tae2 family protein
MSMDGRFLCALAGELDEELAESRINRIYQLSRADFLFLVRGGSKNKKLYVSLSPQNARAHLTSFDYDKPAIPSGFCMLLRKHLEGGIIRGVTQMNADRILRIEIENVNDYGVVATYAVIVELMGKHANLVVADSEGSIIDCFQRVSPFEDQQRTFLKGFRYELPDDGKIHPDDLAAVASFFAARSELDAVDIVKAIRGFSSLSAEHLLRVAFNRCAALPDVYRDFLASPVEPTSALVEGKRKFYWMDLFGDVEKERHPSLSALLDDHFSDIGRQERMNQVSKNVVQVVRRESDRARTKLEKLAAELDAARDAVRYRIAGDMIIQHLPEIRKGDDLLRAESYVDGQPIEIVLDRLLEPMENAEAYFKKYKKAKAAVVHIEGQIVATERDIAYFDLLTTQLETASMNDLLEIVEELKANRYLKEKSPVRKKNAPSYDSFRTPDGIEIAVGKNNVQNDYVTHRLAKPSEWWFHAKDVPGSHVLVRHDGDLSEATIRAAANLAACHSKARYSSSVAVDYTLARHVKKIPGEIGSFVTYANQKTIFIDPDPEAVQRMRPARKA